MKWTDPQDRPFPDDPIDGDEPKFERPPSCVQLLVSYLLVAIAIALLLLAAHYIGPLLGGAHG